MPRKEDSHLPLAAAAGARATPEMGRRRVFMKPEVPRGIATPTFLPHQGERNERLQEVVTENGVEGIRSTFDRRQDGKHRKV